MTGTKATGVMAFVLRILVFAALSVVLLILK